MPMVPDRQKQLASVNGWSRSRELHKGKEWSYSRTAYAPSMRVRNSCRGSQYLDYNSTGSAVCHGLVIASQNKKSSTSGPVRHRQRASRYANLVQDALPCKIRQRANGSCPGQTCLSQAGCPPSWRCPDSDPELPTFESLNCSNKNTCSQSSCSVDGMKACQQDTLAMCIHPAWADIGLRTLQDWYLPTGTPPCELEAPNLPYPTTSDEGIVPSPSLPDIAINTTCAVSLESISPSLFDIPSPACRLAGQTHVPSSEPGNTDTSGLLSQSTTPFSSGPPPSNGHTIRGTRPSATPAPSEVPSLGQPKQGSTRLLHHCSNISSDYHPKCTLQYTSDLTKSYSESATFPKSEWNSSDCQYKCTLQYTSDLPKSYSESRPLPKSEWCQQTAKCRSEPRAISCSGLCDVDPDYKALMQSEDVIEFELKGALYSLRQQSHQKLSRISYVASTINVNTAPT